MKSSLICKAAAAGVAASLFLTAGSAFATEELFKRSNCMACHAVDQKRVGPSLKEVAAKYKGDGSAARMLAEKIRKGGGGVWGQMPMPPQPQVSEADAKVLAEYILSLQ